MDSHFPITQSSTLQVHGPNFIIQRPETFAQVFPKLRLRWLHQREMHLVVKPSGSSDSAASSTALVRRAEPAQQLPVAYDGQFQFVDLTQLLEQVEAANTRPMTTTTACSVVSSSTARPGLVHVPMDAEQHVRLANDLEVDVRLISCLPLYCSNTSSRLNSDV